MSISQEELVTYFFNKAWIEVEKDFELEHAVVPLRGSKNNLFESITKSVKMRVHSFTIREILEGNADLRVPRVLCIVHKPIHHLEDVGVVNLVDSTGCMNGYITSNCLKMHKGIFQAGSAIVLENCSLFINKIPLERHINIHDENVIAVYTNQS